MARFLIRRLLALIPVLLVVAIVTFTLIHMMPGDAAAVMLGPNATEEQVAQLRTSLGLDQPLVVQFFAWLGNILTGDLGESVFIHRPVAEILATALAPTVNLALLAEIIAIIVGVPAGIMAARHAGSARDKSFMTGAMIGISMPSFLTGLLLMLIFSVLLGWFPVAGYRALEDGPMDTLRYLVLPAVALGLMQAALIARMTRTSMLETLSKNYMKTAKAKGLAGNKIVYKHALKNASLPIITTIGQTLGTLLAGAAVVETVFSIPGIGQLIVNSIERRDIVVIQGVVLLIAVVYVVINFIVDVLYSILDPRVRMA
ncbi:ABC transporter permease [Brevibacterium sp. 91QC2O2]|uniref:ABC transporter permease n=1 Tax=Brevibacterium TaxID=1696 RepID=UPI00211BD2BB|nr:MULTISPECIES: ABC transporter permease [unclassified Brevibacterium]MCQ9368863.1 ABC transporter permease [Brevibacterium sp. 91QC2O2]MCQ9386638.1 ABC transporter permease [Brevibacterium sp. 68QC2CO]